MTSPSRRCVAPARLPLLLAVLHLSSGCTAYSLLGGATTVPKSDWEFAVMPGASRDAFSYTGDENRFTFEAAARRGMTDWFDLGLRVYTTGAALEGRFQLYASPDELPGLNALVSLSPGVTGAGGTLCDGAPIRCVPMAIPFVNLSVVAGIRASRLIEVVVAQRSTFELVWPMVARFIGPQMFGPSALGPGQAPMFSIGADLAVVFHLPRGWRVAPEVTLLVPIVPNPPVLIMRIHYGLGVFKTF